MAGTGYLAKIYKSAIANTDLFWLTEMDFNMRNSLLTYRPRKLSLVVHVTGLPTYISSKTLKLVPAFKSLRV